MHKFWCKLLWQCGQVWVTTTETGSTSDLFMKTAVWAIYSWKQHFNAENPKKSLYVFLNFNKDFLFYLVSFLLAFLYSGVVRGATCIHQVFININCYFVVRHKKYIFIINNITRVVVCQYSRFSSYLREM